VRRGVITCEACRGGRLPEETTMTTTINIPAAQALIEQYMVAARDQLKYAKIIARRAAAAEWKVDAKIDHKHATSLLGAAINSMDVVRAMRTLMDDPSL